jgi:glucosamine--fructose-6-phosphate aminotransferase (isomerizing)
MYLTEKEIGLEFESAGKSVQEAIRHGDRVRELFENKKRCWFIGSGSSHTLGKSAAAMLLLYCEMDAYAVSAGDMLLHFERYAPVLQDSVVVFMSRSGSTSEVVKTAELIRRRTNADCVSLCARENSTLDEFCGLNIHIPWAFDESVCQTKTVGSIYAGLAAIAALVGQNEELLECLLALPSQEAAFSESIMALVRETAAQDWEHVVVLADSEAAGVMEEGALAFKEICQLNSNFYNVLDVRHGPMVMIDSKTFVFILLEEPQKMALDLITDIKAKGAFCVVGGAHDYQSCADGNIVVPETGAVLAGLFSLYFLQLVSLHKAIVQGINPDSPEGLSPWIEIH